MMLDKNTQARLTSTLPMKRTALLINDVQNDMVAKEGKVYRHAVKDPAAITAFIRSLEGLTAAARTAGILIIYLANTHTVGAKDVSDESLRRWGRATLAEAIDDVPVIAGTWGHCIVDALAPKPGDLVIDKSGLNVFRYSMLDKVLRIQGLDCFVLTGLSSYSGILASSYVMQDNGYRFVVPKQCVTGYDPELHAAAMRLMAPQIVDVHDIVGYWTAAST